MADSSADSLAHAYRDATQQYAYFLLAASGAAIGVAVNQTQGIGLSFALLPLGLAVLAWGISFVFGCLQVERQHEFVRLNAFFLQARNGQIPAANSSAQIMAVVLGDTDAAMNLANFQRKRFARWQFRFLVGGGVLYLAWHILQMYLRTP